MEIWKTTYQGNTLSTIRFDLPKMFSAQLNTHGMVPRNSQSSRAVPHKKLDNVPDFLPEFVGLNKSGMQPKSYLEGQDLEWFQDKWYRLQIKIQEELQEIQNQSKLKFGRTIAKEIINRPLDPFKMVKIVATFAHTEYSLENFLKQRCHSHCQGDFRKIALQIEEIIQDTIPIESKVHLPFSFGGTVEEQILSSVANCAAVSYRKEIKDLDRCKDIVYNKLLNQDVVHWSPFHHQGFYGYRWRNHLNRAQFLGTSFAQLRKILYSSCDNSHEDTIKRLSCLYKKSACDS